jgi:hypothetical protein
MESSPLKTNTKVALVVASVSTLVLAGFMTSIFYYQMEKKESKYGSDAAMFHVSTQFRLEGLKNALGDGVNKDSGGE